MAMQFQFRRLTDSIPPVTVEISDECVGQGYFSQRAEALRVILAEHAKWLGGLGGKRASLQGASLRWADLRDADLRDADLRDADLREADLCGADLCGADLRGANLD